MRQAHHAAEARQIALVHPGDLFPEPLLVADGRHREEPALRAVPEHDAHLICRPERIEHAERTIARDLISIRELHAVHDERDGALGQNFLGIELHVHRQRRFERRAAIRAGGVSLVTADANEADAEIAHGAFEQLHVVRADVARREVADEDGVVALHLGKRVRESAEADGAHFQPRGAERLDELRVLLRLDGDDEDARIAAHVHKAGGAIVLRHVVALRLELDGVGVEARIGERLRKRVEILARREIDGLLAERLFVAIKAHGGALRLVGLDEDFCVEGLAFLHAAGQAQLLHGDVVPAFGAERDDIDGHAQRTRLQNRSHGVAEVFVAVGEEHEPLLARLRKRRRAEPQRAADVRAFRSNDRENLRVLGVDLLGGGGFQRGFGAEDEQAGLVLLLLLFRELVHEPARGFLLRGRNGIGAVEQEEDVHAFHRLLPLQARDGEHDEQRDHDAQRDGGPASP